MKYTAEKVRALFEAWAEENGYDVLRIEPDYNDGFTAAAWHGYQTAYAERAQSCEKCKGRGEVFNDVHVRMMTCPHCHGARKVASAEPVAQRDACGEREETWEIWEYGMCVAGADDLGDAQHYLTMYGQDGPVKLVRVISYRETVTPDAIDAYLSENTHG